MNRSLIICDRLMYGALLAMVFFLPFSLALIEICQVTMIMAWLAKSLLSRKMPARQGSGNSDFSSIAWPLIAIGLLIVLTIPFSHYPALSIKKFFTRFLQQILLMYLATQAISSRKRLYGLLMMLLLTFFLVTVDAAIQYVWGKSFVHHTPLIMGRVSGPMSHPNDLGTLLVTVLPLILVLSITCRSWTPLLTGFSKLLVNAISWVGMIAIPLLFVLLVNVLGLSDSRGAWFAFALSMIIFGTCLRRPKVMAVIILLLALFFWAYGAHCLNTRKDLSITVDGMAPSITSLFNPSDREYYWGTAVDVIKRYPWFGCGYSAYVQTLRDIHVGHEEYPHNSLLHITAELGFLGLALYGWFFMALWLKIRDTLRVLSGERDLFLIGCGIASGILAWILHSLLDTPWSSLQLSDLWWLFIGVLLSLKFLLPNHKEGNSAFSA